MYGSIIAWTDNTFNPWMGCAKISPGCKNCYAATLTKNRMGLDLWGSNNSRKVTSITNWKKPVKWNIDATKEGIRSKVFCASLCDVFEDHPTANETRPRLWNLIKSTTNLDWQILTKRPEMISSCLPVDWDDGYENVWIGTSIESNEYAYRADYLREIDCVVRFISYEPAIGYLDQLNLDGIDWVIYGGESGSGFRPHNLDWARNMKQKCEKSETAFFFKQSSAFRTEMGIELDGEIIRQYPYPAIGRKSLKSA